MAYEYSGTFGMWQQKKVRREPCEDRFACLLRALTIEENIPVRIINAFNPENHGTLIVKKQKIKHGDVVKAITLVKDVALVNVSGACMVGAPGTAAKVLVLCICRLGLCCKLFY